MSTSYAAAINPMVGQAISEKLNKNNHALWKMQVLAIVRGARLEGFLTGATKTPPPPASTMKKTADGKEEDAEPTLR